MNTNKPHPNKIKSGYTSTSGAKHGTAATLIGFANGAVLQKGAGCLRLPKIARELEFGRYYLISVHLQARDTRPL